MKLVDTKEDLATASAALRGAPRYLIDTEFETSRTTRQLCLVQITAGEEIFLVDTVRLGRFEAFADAIGRPDAEWVLHAGRQDVEWLDEVMGLAPPERLFDTQVAWGLLGSEFPVSLTYLIYRLLGERISKGYQSVDWTRRPLSEPQMRYAASDVEHLGALRDALGERLAAEGKEALVYDITHELLLPEPKPPPRLSDFRNAWQLDARQQAALRFLLDWLEAIPTEEREWWPTSKTLLAIASRMPRTGRQLGSIKGVHVGWARRQGDRFTEQLQAAADAADTEGFVPLEPPGGPSFEQLRMEKWLDWATVEVCAEVTMAPQVAFPGFLRRKMADAAVDAGDRRAALPCLEGWRDEWLRGRLEALCDAGDAS